MGFTELPDEIVGHVLAHVDSPRDLASFAATSRSSKRLATHPSSWEHHYYSLWRFGDPEREKKRGARVWRQKRKLAALRSLIGQLQSSMAAASSSSPASSSQSLLPSTAFAQGSSQSALGMQESSLRSQRQLPSTSSSANAYNADLVLGRLAAEAEQDAIDGGKMPDFYSLFLQRMRIDAEALDVLERISASKEQCWLDQGHLVFMCGDDIRDLLQKIVACLTITAESLEASEDAVASKPGETETHRQLTVWQLHELSRPHRSAQAKPFVKNHIRLLHLASSMLDHLQRRQSVRLVQEIAGSEARRHDEQTSQPQGLQAQGPATSLRDEVTLSAQETEDALCAAVTGFAGGNVEETREYLDLLAVETYLSTDSQLTPRCSSSRKAQVIAQHLVSTYNFSIATDRNFLDLNNSFPHMPLFSPSYRDTLPLTLITIFCAVARRLGIAAAPCDTPYRIVAMVLDEGDPSAEEPISYVDFSQMTGSSSDATQAEDPASTIHIPLHDASSIRRILQIQTAPRSPGNGLKLMTRSMHNILGAVRYWNNVGATPPTRSTAPSASSQRRQRPRRFAGAEEAEGGHPSVTGADTATEAFSGRRSVPEYLQGLLRASGNSHSREVYEDVYGKYDSVLDPLAPTTASLLPCSRVSPHRSHLEGRTATGALCAAFWILVVVSIDRPVGALSHMIEAKCPLDILLYPGTEVIWRRAWQKANKCEPLEEEAAEDEGGAGSDSSLEEGDVDTNSPISPPDRARILYLAESYFKGSSRLSEPSPSTTTSSHLPGTTSSPPFSPSSRPGYGLAIPPFPLGTLFTHLRYSYHGVILSKDETCEAGDGWIEAMNVDALPNGGRNQRFYNVLVDDGTQRYVAECNIQPFQRGKRKTPVAVGKKWWTAFTSLAGGRGGGGGGVEDTGSGNPSTSRGTNDDDEEGGGGGEDAGESLVEYHSLLRLEEVQRRFSDIDVVRGRLTRVPWEIGESVEERSEE